MLELSNITLIVVDSIHQSKSLRAVEKCLQVANFGEVITLFDIEINTIEDYSKFILQELYKHVNMDFALLIQWDGFIVNPNAWTNAFLGYDYIGAPWWYSGHNVGNGGFSLRSKFLMEKTASLTPTHPEDDSIRQNADLLKSKGVVFAPEELAAIFSWEENSKYRKYNNSFGFHGAQHLTRFL